VEVQCSEGQDKIILAPLENIFLKPELEGVRLTAEVKGIRVPSGNVQKYSTRWSFMVNVSPVAWNPEEVLPFGRAV